MQLKRFQAPDTRQAMQMIKHSLGDDAVILSNSKIAQGVEIVAAIDYDAQVVQQSPTEQPISSAKFLNDSNFTKVEEEIKMMREMLNDKLQTSTSSQGPNHPLLHKLDKVLKHAGLSAPLSRRVLAKINLNQGYQEAMEEVFIQIGGELRTFDQDELSHQGTHVFVGPTGVGKTTTIAKLAARFCLRYGSQKLGLITTDTYRVAAVDQLKVYANILGVDVELAKTPEDLQQAIMRNRHKQLVLVDTAGLSIQDTRLIDQIDMIASMTQAIQCHGVLAATCQQSVLQDLINLTQSRRKINSIISTKIDEASYLGAIISCLIENQLPLSYITHGQRVPEDIQRCQKSQFIRQFIQSLEARSHGHVSA